MIRPLSMSLGLVPSLQNFLEMPWEVMEGIVQQNEESNCSLLEPAFFVESHGVKLVRGTRVPFPVGGPQSKYEALFNPLPCFDAIRESYCLGTHSFVDILAKRSKRKGCVCQRLTGHAEKCPMHISYFGEMPYPWCDVMTRDESEWLRDRSDSKKARRS